MAVSHRLLTSVLLLLPFITDVSAQQGCSVSDSNPSVYENNPPGYVVTTIHMEQGFTVRIDPNSYDADYFTINTSELQLRQSVDYETTAVLIASLICENSAGQRDGLEIPVTILNMNDNSPAFVQTNLTKVVPEDAKVNATIVARGNLSASDADLDIIFYELKTIVPGTEGYFAIKGVNNPEIYLQKALNYEKFNMTTLVLYAMDRPVGSTEMTNTATATINIFIEQADTRSPWFLPCTFINTEKSICISSTYIGTVKINEVPMEPFVLEPGPIYAIDPDYSLNEKIVYSIVGGDADNVFSVHPDTGNLTMNKAATSLDSYMLQVMATQVNNIQKYSIATVQIKVTAENYKPPYFHSRIYNGTVFVGLAPRSIVFQDYDSLRPLMITAADDDFPNNANPNIDYYIKNSSDFIATKDGFILTNVMLGSEKTVTIEAVGRDTVSLQEASTLIVVDVIRAPAVTLSENTHTTQDMAALGGTLAALLLIALVLLGVMTYKMYGKSVKYLFPSQFSKVVFGGYQNQSYKQNEYQNVSTQQHKTSENGSVQSMTHVLEQPALSLPSSNAVEIASLSKASVAPTIIFDQEEKEEEMEEETEHEKEVGETEHEKEVKSILKTDRRVADDGYKAVWFKTDVDPDAGDTAEVIEDNAADGDDDSDKDLQEEEEEEEEDYDKDNHHRGLGVSFASEGSSLPAAGVIIDMDRTDAVTDDSEL